MNKTIIALIISVLCLSSVVFAEGFVSSKTDGYPNLPYGNNYCAINPYVSKYCMKCTYNSAKCPYIRNTLFAICNRSTTLTQLKSFMSNFVGFNNFKLGWNWKLGPYWFVWIKR